MEPLDMAPIALMSDAFNALIVVFVVMLGMVALNDWFNGRRKR